MKISKYLVEFAVVAAVSIAPLVTLADDASPSPSAVVKSEKTSRQRKDAAEQKRQERKDKREENKAESEKKRDQKKEEKSDVRVLKFWADMSRRLSKLLENEKRFAKQISNRLDRAAANGKDVSALKVKLDAAKKLVVDADAALKVADAQVKDIVKNSSDGKTAFEKVKALEKDLRDQIKVAHQALVDVGKAIKGEKPNPSVSPSASATPKPTASPSPSPSPSTT